MSKQSFALACGLCLVAGYLVGNVRGFDPLQPLNPKHDRPIARLLANVARLGLWVAVFAEPTPTHCALTLDGCSGDGMMLCHAEGW